MTEKIKKIKSSLERCKKERLKRYKKRELLFICLHIIEEKRGKARADLIEEAKKETGAVLLSEKTVIIWIKDSEIREELFAKISARRKVIKGKGPEVGGLLLITFKEKASERDIYDLLAFFIFNLTNTLTDIYFLTSTRNHSNNGSIRRFTTSNKNSGQIYFINQNCF